MPLAAVHTLAPEFSLRDQRGNEVSNASLRGKWAVLYFYPKDDTPGCTREACNFRDNFPDIEAAGAAVYGVSGDSAVSHEKFAGKYSLPFPLLVDEGNSMARAFGAWGKKNMYGKVYEGIIRSTVILDPQGRVAKTWPKAKPDTNASEVLDWLRAHAN